MNVKSAGMHRSFSAVLDPKHAKLVLEMDITDVCEGLYLCAYEALTEEKLKTRKITRIINAAREAPKFEMSDVELTHLSVSDLPSEDISQFFDHCADLIHTTKQGGGNTLVHCALGISRSVTICLAYMVKYEACTLRSAFFDIRKLRPIIKPNNGFWRQLINYEQTLKGAATVKMRSFPMGSEPDVYQTRVGRTNFRR